MRRLFLLLLVSAIWPAHVLAEEIILQVEHPKSRRLAILEDNQTVAYLYLTQPGVPRPERDAVVYSRVPLAPTVDWKKLKESGEPPQLAADVASSRAVIAQPVAREFTFRWSQDGHTVALLRNGEPLAMVSVRNALGYSKAIAKRSRLANAWDEKRYVELIGRQAASPAP